MAETTPTLTTFSKNAADLVRLRAWLYGWGDAQVLMMRCYRRSKATTVNERTVGNVWAELDAAMDAEGLWEQRVALMAGLA